MGTRSDRKEHGSVAQRWPRTGVTCKARMGDFPKIVRVLQGARPGALGTCCGGSAHTETDLCQLPAPEWDTVPHSRQGQPRLRPDGSVHTADRSSVSQIKTIGRRDCRRKAKHLFSSEVPVFKGEKWRAFGSRHSELLVG